RALASARLRSMICFSLGSSRSFSSWARSMPTPTASSRILSRSSLPVNSIRALCIAWCLPCLAEASAAIAAILEASPRIRQVLVDDLDLAVGARHRLHGLVGALAVRALVVVELDDGDVAVGVAADRAFVVAVELAPVLLDPLGRDVAALVLLLLLELLHRLDQDLGVGEDVLAHRLGER